MLVVVYCVSKIHFYFYFSNCCKLVFFFPKFFFNHKLFNNFNIFSHSQSFSIDIFGVKYSREQNMPSVSDQLFIFFLCCCPIFNWISSIFFSLWISIIVVFCHFTKKNPSQLCVFLEFIHSLMNF